MAAPSDRSVISPVMVGRAAAVESLQRFLDSAAVGRGQTLLIAGEAGIGKSRLAAEARVSAARLGIAVLQGQCFEPDRALPYGPLLDLLRAWLAGRSPEQVKPLLAAPAHELIKLLPELAPLALGAAQTPALDPEQERNRLFQALAAFLMRLAAPRTGHASPLLVVVEDLHWSDEVSLGFLLYLAQRVPPGPICLLLTYRSDEDQEELTRFLAGLDRKRLASEVLLTRLTRADVDKMIRAIFSLERPVRPQFLDSIYALTEGNPFFIEEVLKSLLTAGDVAGAPDEQPPWDRTPLERLRIPRSVRDALTRRTQRLSDAAHWVLTLAAVAGRRFDFGLLQELTQMSEQDLTQELKTLLRAQLVVEESADIFAFRHALTREAAYSTLLRRERRHYHQIIAETLEHLHAGALHLHLGDLAYHYYQAETWPKALEYAQQAGERAQAMYALHAAIEHFTRALEAADQLAPRPPMAQLYRARGQTHEMAGDFERARADLEAALDLARAADDRRGEWQTLLDLGFLWASRDYTRTGDYFQRALEAARTLDDPEALARTLNRLASWHTNVERPHEAVPLHQEALSIFQRLDDRRGLAETFDLTGLALTMTGDWIQGGPLQQQAAALYRELGDRRGLSSMLASLAEPGTTFISLASCVPRVAPAEVRARAEEAVRIAREIDWPSGEAYALAELGWALASQGDYGAALAHQQEGLAIAHEIEHRLWLCIGHAGLGLLYLDLFALPEAEQELVRALALAHEVNTPMFVRWSTGGLAACLMRRDPNLAEKLLRANAGFDPAELTDPEPGREPQLSAMQRSCAVAWAELALRQEDAPRALAIADALVASSPKPEPPADDAIAPLCALRGEALTRLGRLEEAETALQAGLRAAEARGWRPLAMRIHARLGRALHAQGRRAEADEEFAHARALVEALAATVPALSLRRNFQEHAAALVPPEPKPTPRRAEQQAFGGLTRRERQVAALIAQGKSNRAIADALVLGERTVEYHVSNILSKLGFGSRSQIAAWAVEKGLK